MTLALAATASRAPAQPADDAPHILLVDDDRRIRDLLAARYGWADCWIGLVADTRRSVAVRLECGDA